MTTSDSPASGFRRYLDDGAVLVAVFLQLLGAVDDLVDVGEEVVPLVRPEGAVEGGLLDVLVAPAGDVRLTLLQRRGYDRARHLRHRRAGQSSAVSSPRVRKVANFYIISNLEILYREIYDYKQ